MEVRVLEARELVEEIVRALVDQPEKVVCREVVGQHSCVLELEVAREDVGKVIGRKGIHADAITPARRDAQSLRESKPS